MLLHHAHPLPSRRGRARARAHHVRRSHAGLRWSRLTCAEDVQSRAMGWRSLLLRRSVKSPIGTGERSPIGVLFACSGHGSSFEHPRQAAQVGQLTQGFHGDLPSMRCARASQSSCPIRPKPKSGHARPPSPCARACVPHPPRRRAWTFAASLACSGAALRRRTASSWAILTWCSASSRATRVMLHAFGRGQFLPARALERALGSDASRSLPRPFLACCSHTPLVGCGGVEDGVALDQMLEIAAHAQGVAGARLSFHETGGGWLGDGRGRDRRPRR